jgi:hypothetical protein
MGEVIRFVSKSERERVRLIRQARAIYDSIFPADDTASERQHHDTEKSHDVRRGRPSQR